VVWNNRLYIQLCTQVKRVCIYIPVISLPAPCALFHGVFSLKIYSTLQPYKQRCVEHIGYYNRIEAMDSEAFLFSTVLYFAFIHI